jgi:hypothetical protein
VKGDAKVLEAVFNSRRLNLQVGDLPAPTYKSSTGILPVSIRKDNRLEAYSTTDGHPACAAVSRICGSRREMAPGSSRKTLGPLNAEFGGSSRSFLPLKNFAWILKTP